MKKLFNWYFPNKDEHFTSYPGVEHYQHDRIDAALEFLPENKRRIAVDVGAHIGLLTKKLAEHFDLVYAFEPDPENFACLVINTVPCGNVIRIQVALGKSDSRATMGGIETNSGSNYIEISLDGKILVEKLDNFKLPACDLIKLDVQGFELFVLKGGKHTIKKYKPIIILEEENDSEIYSRYKIKRTAAIEWLYARGYKRKATIHQDVILVYESQNTL